MEKFDLENFPKSESALKMLSYVSGEFYEKSYVGKWLYQVMGIEYDAALQIVEELPDQFFPETATWGLMYHEIKWGLPVRTNLSYDERRRLIYQKRDYRSPMIPYRMEKYLEDVTGFEVHIADIHDPGKYGFIPTHPNMFKAYFLGEGTLDAKAVFKTLDNLKQSHTIYEVNERTEIVLDSRQLEQFLVKRILFKMALPFWYGYIFDGSWQLDGSILLDNRPNYELGLAVSLKQGIYMQEKIIWAGLRFWAGNVVNSHIFHSRGRFYFSICEYSNLALNNKQRYVIMNDAEAVGNLTVITKSNNYWFFDGSYLLDGTKNLNSIYKKEGKDQ